MEVNIFSYRQQSDDLGRRPSVSLLKKMYLSAKMLSTNTNIKRVLFCYLICVKGAGHTKIKLRISPLSCLSL